MANLSDWAETALLSWVMTTDAVTRPTAWYVALFTAAPSDTGGGTEVSGGGYARQAVTFTVTNDTASNSTAETFTASGASWGTITHIGIFDASTGGNLIAHGALTTSRTISDGDSLNFAIGDIDLTLA